MTSTAWLLLAAFLAVAALDWVAVHLRSKPLEYLCKPGCMLVLIGAALALEPADEAARSVLVAALVLSTAGDVFLMLPGRRPGTFVAGLSAFLLAHVAYVVAFALDGLSAVPLAIGVAVALALGLGVGRQVVRGVRRGPEPQLAAPVTAYIAVISTMVLAAVGTGDGRAIAGALLFSTSDALIARERFLRPAPWQPLTIIVTYNVAQALLTTSFV